MATKTIRVSEDLYEDVRDLADRYDTTPRQILDEVWVQTDLDDFVGNAAPTIGRCPDCGHEFTGDDVETGVLTGKSWVTCPESERDDDVHGNQNRYEISELNEA